MNKLAQAETVDQTVGLIAELTLLLSCERWKATISSERDWGPCFPAFSLQCVSQECFLCRYPLPVHPSLLLDSGVSSSSSSAPPLLVLDLMSPAGLVALARTLGHVLALCCLELGFQQRLFV